MKNVDFICFWSRAANENIFVYKIILRKQINAKRRARERERESKKLSEQKHKQQFSVQKKQQRFGIYEHKNRREKNNMNFIQEEFRKNNGNVWVETTIRLVFHFWTTRILYVWSCVVKYDPLDSFVLHGKKQRNKNRILCRKFSSRQFLHVTWNIQIWCVECSHMCILFQPSELITCKKWCRNCREAQAKAKAT